MKKTLVANMTKCKTQNYTPSDVVDHCMKLIDIEESDILLDPFYGDGAFYKRYPAITHKVLVRNRKSVDFSPIPKN